MRSISLNVDQEPAPWYSNRPSRVFWAACCGSFVFLFACIGAAEADEVLQKRAELYTEYSVKLGRLADDCRRLGLADQASEIDRWLPDREADKTYLFVLREIDGFPRLPSGASEAQARCHKQFVALRTAQANELFKLAQKAIDADPVRPSLAYELVMEGARENPENEKLRRLLGDRPIEGRWMSAFAATKIEKHYVNHAQYGWIRKTYVPRYEKGERQLGGRWMSKEKAAELMAGSIDRGWTLETEHYSITTNDTWEAGVALGRRLERLYALWQQLFIQYHASETEIRQLVKGRQPIRRRPKKYNVVYFRTRSQYNDFLRKSQPRIEITLGIYFDDVRRAYFFAGEDQNDTTLFHEATHQLFQETRPVAKQIAHDANFWAVEGIACYMESLTDRGGYYTLGGLKEGRVPAARIRLLEHGFYVPLDELTQFGRRDLQHDKRIAKIYSQASGLATFLMHHDGGRYRGATVAYLQQIYTNRANAATLSKLTGAKYDDLDRAYREFLQIGDR